MNAKAVYLGDLYTKKGLVDIIVNLKQSTSYIALIIGFWEDNLCPDCGAPCKPINYVNKCSASPDTHSLCDGEFYLNKIKKSLEEHALYRTRKKTDKG